jgi:hypothetical protein
MLACLDVLKIQYAARGGLLANTPYRPAANKDCAVDSRGIEDRENRW